MYLNNIKFNPSETDKYSNDMEMAKTIASNYFGVGISPERIKRLRENIELHSGRWEELESLSTGQQITIGAGDEQETFTIGDLKIRHYDKIGRITRGMHGQFIAAPMVAIIKDISSKSKSLKDKLKLEGVKELMYNKYIAPKIELITKQELSNTGFKSIFDLQPEQQQELQNIISQRVQKESPEEIMAIMDKIKTPDEQVCQLMFGYTKEKEKLKHKYDNGVLWAIVNGEEYYRPYISNGCPKLDVLIPEGVTFGGSPNIEYVQDGTFATYTQYLSIEDCISRFGATFLKDDLDQLAKYFHPESTNGYTGISFNNRINMAMTEIIGEDPNLRDKNFLTRDGQQILNAIYSRVGSGISNYRIPHYYATFKWTTRMKLVTRLYKGKPKDYIVAGHYRKNPSTDLKVKTIVVPQVWDVERLSTHHFVSCGPRDYQYESIYNPFDVKLGIYGGMFNNMMGTTKNYSFVDNGKVWNYRYDLAMARKDEIESTNHGRIALMTMNAKPNGITWEDWLNGILTNKLGIVANNSDFMNPEDKKVFQSLDLSRVSDAASVIQDLQYAESELHKSMYFTGAKVGEIGQYTTNQNAYEQIQAANMQLMSFNQKHQEICTAVSHQMLKLTLIAYRDNEIVKDAVLDDFLKAHYELNMKDEDICQYALALIDTQIETESIKQMKSLAMSFVQNQIISLGELSRLFSAQTMAEIQDVIDDAERKRDKKIMESSQEQKELAAQNAKIQQDLIKMKQDFDAIQNDLDRKVKVTLAEISSHLMSNANDIDGNKVNDALQKALAEIEAKKRMHSEKLVSDEKIALMQLQSKEKTSLLGQK